jgi:periplasmic divalent cation tolerance protein
MVATDARLVLTTAASIEEARSLGNTLVEERLAACATLIPGIESIYHWQNKVESSRETMLLLKTVTDKLEALEARLLGLHSYDTPEFLVLPVDHASEAYLAWMCACLRLN